jgi:hypothetical protein
LADDYDSIDSAKSDSGKQKDIKHPKTLKGGGQEDGCSRRRGVAATRTEGPKAGDPARN